MTSERKKRARCALCDTTESPAGWYAWNNRPTVKFCFDCWAFVNPAPDSPVPSLRKAIAAMRRVCRI